MISGPVESDDLATRDSDTRRFAPGPRAGCQPECRAAGRHFEFVGRNRTATSEPMSVSFIQARCRDRDATARLLASLTEYTDTSEPLAASFILACFKPHGAVPPRQAGSAEL